MSGQRAMERDAPRSRADQTRRSAPEDDARGRLVAGLPMGERWTPFIDYNLERARAPEAKAGLRTLMLKLDIPADLARIAVTTTLIWGRRHGGAT